MKDHVVDVFGICFLQVPVFMPGIVEQGRSSRSRPINLHTKVYS